MLDFFRYKKQDFICPRCGWKCKGAELANGEFSEENSIADLECPSCGEHIGFWQAPLAEEIEKWKKENPGVDTGWGKL